MKIYLDDVRDTPEGWVRCFWPNEVIALIEQGKVEVISLDHDLGDDQRGDGYDVMAWLEEKVFTDHSFVPPEILFHSMNPVAVKRMEQTRSMILHRIANR